MSVGRISSIKTVATAEIREMPVKIRKMTPEERALLVRSILETGYVEPIQVCYYTRKPDFVDADPPFYLIVNGQHRFEVLRDEFKADRITVVVLGENWDEARYWTEAIRLNNIRGEYDLIKLADRLKRIKEKLGQIDRDRLGFTAKDLLFKRAMKLAGEHLSEAQKSELKRRLEAGDMSGFVQKLSEYLQEAVRQKTRLLMFVSGNMQMLMVRIEDEKLWSKLVRASESDPEALYTALMNFITGLGEKDVE